MKRGRVIKGLKHSIFLLVFVSGLKAFATLPGAPAEVQLSFYDQDFNFQTIKVEQSSLPPNLNSSILELHEKGFEFSGPNCFATALYAVGIKQNIIGVDGPEFGSALDLFCDQVTEPQAGDIGVITTKGGDFNIHAFTYISKDIAFEKQNPDGGRNGTPIRFVLLQQVLNRTMYSQECLRTGGDIQSCSNRLVYYSCDRQNANKVPVGLSDLKKNLNETEVLVNQIVELGRESLILDSQSLRVLQNQVSALSLQTAALQMLDLHRVTKGEIWKRYLENQLQSIKLQMRFFELGLPQQKPQEETIVTASLSSSL